MLPRVVLVDDDAAMRLYVETALDHLAIDLVCCVSADAAWRVLSQGPDPALIITDVMLGAQSGIALIERLRAGSDPLASTRVVVTSAAIDATGVMDRLRPLGAWRLLPKPVALVALEACVLDALSDLATAGATAVPSATVSGAGERTMVDAGCSEAMAQLFGGDRTQYFRYRQTCLMQLAADVAQGDADVERGDAASLRRLAHNLRSALRTLGETGGAAQADQLELALAANDRHAARAVWRGLRCTLLALMDGA